MTPMNSKCIVKMCHYRPSGLSGVKSSSDRRDSIIFGISFKDVHNYIDKQEVNNKKANKERSQFKKNKIGSWYNIGKDAQE
jgi:hypothetical protein